MTHEEIQKSFQYCGQYLTGRDYAMIKTIEKLITPKREWVGLTNEEMTECIVEICNTDDGTGGTRDLIRLVEAKLKEKNT